MDGLRTMQEHWHEASVVNYPDYLPSFDEFVADFNEAVHIYATAYLPPSVNDE